MMARLFKCTATRAGQVVGRSGGAQRALASQQAGARPLAAAARLHGAPGHKISPSRAEVTARAYQPNNNRKYSTPGGGGMKTIDWEAGLTNSVSMIGNLGKDPEVKYLESGRTVVNFGIALKTRKDGEPSWIDVEAWNEVAQAAEKNLSRGMQVHVKGRLNQTSWTDRQTGQKRYATRVIADELALVASNPSASGGNGGGAGGSYGASNYAGAGASAGGASNYSSSAGSSSAGFAKDAEARWAALFCNPNDFWDNRAGKRNPRSPDFKHKETGEALWVQSKTTPTWVESSLREMDANRGMDMGTLMKDAYDAPPPGRNEEEIPF